MSDRNSQPITTSGMAIERRRPGRRDVNPMLIPLLRRPAGDGSLCDTTVPDLEAVSALNPGQDPLGAARGVAVSVLLSVSVWGVMGALGMVF